jgi:vancomycin permeability regulator SanA
MLGVSATVGTVVVGALMGAALVVRGRGRPVVLRLAGDPVAERGSARPQPEVAQVSAPVVIVPGARVFPSGRLSLTLRGRLDTALALYWSGRVERFLVSGANDLPGLGEAEVMRDYLVARGVPVGDICTDEEGVSTWATVRRARRVFGVSRAVFVTQHPYADRAGTLCRAAGLDAVVVSIDPPRLRHRRWVMARVRGREALANVKACVVVATGSLWPRA